MSRAVHDRAAISACIVRCSTARDGRMRWRAEARCADALLRNGTPPNIAHDCAAAARAIGTWLAGVQP